MYIHNRLGTILSIITLLAGSNLSAGVVRLAWDAATEPVAGYNIYRQDPDRTQLTQLNSTPVVTTQFEDRTAQTAALYYYTVRSIDSQGAESHDSNRVAAIAGGEPDVRLEAQPEGEFVAGLESSYKVAVTNQGSAPNGSILVLELEAPTGFSWSGTAGSDWVCSGQTRLRCIGDINLLPNDQSTLEAFFQIEPETENGGVLEAALYAADGLLGRHQAASPQLRYRFYAPSEPAEDQRFVSFSVGNYSRQEASVDIEVVGPSGPSALQNESSRIDLAPGGQLVHGNSRDREATGTEKSTWVQLTTANPDLGGFFQFGDLALQCLDGAPLLNGAWQEAYFSFAAVGERAFQGRFAETYLHLLNPTQREAVLELEFIESAPKSQTTSIPTQIDRHTATLSLFPGQLLLTAVEELFPALPGTALGHIRMKLLEGSGVTGFARVEFDNGGSVLGIGASQPSGSDLYSAQVANGPGILTYLTLLNTSDRPRQIELTVFGDDGQPIASPVHRSIEPGKALAGNLREILALSDGSFQGSLMVQADAPGLVGDILWAEPHRMEFAASLPLQRTPSSLAAFHYLADTPELFTGLAVWNPNDESVRLTLEARDSQGTSLQTVQLDLQPKQRVSSILPELMPKTAGQIGGYVLLEASNPVVAQQMFGRRDLRLLSAVPANGL